MARHFEAGQGARVILQPEIRIAEIVLVGSLTGIHGRRFGVIELRASPNFFSLQRTRPRLLR